MIFKISKASDDNYESTKELNTLEELIQFIKESGGRVVISQPDVYVFNQEHAFEIKIYDYYIE